MKTLVVYLGLRAGPDSVPFAKAPHKYQVALVVVGGAVAVVVGKLLGL